MSHRLAVARAAEAAGFEVHVAAPDHHVWAPDNFTVDDLRRAGFQFHQIPLSRRGTNPFQDLETFLSLVRLYRRLRPDVVHHLTIKPVLYGGLAARLTGVKGVVATVTGLGQIFVAVGLQMTLLRRAILLLYRLAARHPNMRLIVQNSNDGDVLVNAGVIFPRNIELIRGSGATMTEFLPTPEPSGVPLVILPARLIWEKGVAEFVDAARMLKNKGIQARFALVGDTQPSNPRAVPETILRQWQAEGVIEWWGRRNAMAQVYAEASVVCLPTTYGEGVPKVLIEAAASGRPIVTTDTPGCREVAREGENALLAPPGDKKKLALALEQILADKCLRARLGARGREIAVAEFDEKDVATRTVAIYRTLHSLPAKPA